MTPAEQQLCLNPGKNVIVEACAGSGKTWLLTARIVRILLENEQLEPSQILAITFTNAAVAEIEQRVTERFKDMRDADDSKLDVFLAELAVKPTDKLRRSARNLYHRHVMSQHRMVIKTFHGWFLHLDKYLPWAERTSMGATLSTDDQLVQKDAFNNFLEQALSAENTSLNQALARMLGRHKPPELQTMLATLLTKRVAWELHFGTEITTKGCKEKFLAEFTKTHKPDQTLAELDCEQTWQLLQRNLTMIRTDCGLDGDATTLAEDTTLPQYQQKLFFALVELEQERDFALINELVAAVLTNTGEIRKFVAKKYATRPEFQELLEFLAAYQEATNWKIMQPYNEDAIELAVAYAQCYTARKQELGVFDYADIELTALRAFKHDELVLEIGQRLEHSLCHILIDEFQDTSPSQWEIMRRWLEVAHDNNAQPSVFIVGDPKQSIYSFQGGDPQVLVAATQFLEQNYAANKVGQNTTRRCAQPVVDVVNQVFTQKSPESEIPLLTDFTAHDTLQHELAGQVTVLKLASEDKEVKEEFTELRNPLTTPRKQPSLSSTAVEGQQLANWLKNVIGQVAITAKDGTRRPCRPDDVMLLYPTRRGVADVLRQLTQAEIPCAAAASANRVQDLECQDLIALMETIFDPGYGLALAHVLRSPIFGVSEDDLMQISQAVAKSNSKLWYQGFRAARGSKELTRAQRLLGAWREQFITNKFPAHEILARCFVEADIINRYVASVPRALGKRVVRNLEWVLHTAIDSKVQLAEYAEYLKELGKLSSLSIAESNQEGMVRATTVHGAKGLESPLVIVSNSFAKTRSDAEPGLLLNWANREGKRMPNNFSFLWRKEWALQTQLDCLAANAATKTREYANMLYVALTRAKQSLVISAKPSQQKTLLWHEQVAQAVRDCGGSETATEVVYGEIPSAPPATVASTADDVKQLAVFTPPDKDIGFVKPWQDSNARWGTQLHTMLGLVLLGITDPDDQMQYLGLTPAEIAELNQRANTILSQEQVAKLLAEKISLDLEVPIVSETGTLGRIDCLLTTKECLWILDFKSATKPDVERYRPQLERYKTALEGAGETRPIRLALIGGQGGLTEIN